MPRGGAVSEQKGHSVQKAGQGSGCFDACRVVRLKRQERKYIVRAYLTVCWLVSFTMAKGLACSVELNADALCNFHVWCAVPVVAGQ